MCVIHPFKVKLNVFQPQLLLAHHCAKRSLSTATTMLATSKHVVFPGHNHLLTARTDDLTLWFNYFDNKSVGSSVPVVSRWIWSGNRTFLKVASIVVTWWIQWLFWTVLTSPACSKCFPRSCILTQYEWWPMFVMSSLFCKITARPGGNISDACVNNSYTRVLLLHLSCVGLPQGNIKRWIYLSHHVPVYLYRVSHNYFPRSVPIKNLLSQAV